MNKYEKMSRGQKLTFLEEQSVLKVLDEHYADKENSKISLGLQGVALINDPKT